MSLGPDLKLTRARCPLKKNVKFLAKSLGVFFSKPDSFRFHRHFSSHFSGFFTAQGRLTISGRPDAIERAKELVLMEVPRLFFFFFLNELLGYSKVFETNFFVDVFFGLFLCNFFHSLFNLFIL